MKKWLKFTSVPVLAVLILLMFYLYSAESRIKGPAQPIFFSHKIHAGDNEIPCEYCHSYVEISPVPGIPSDQKCIGCHLFILGKDEDYHYDGKSINMKNEIQKVKDYWDRNEPIPWIKVNFLPQFVHFNHKRHIRREIECQACHGEVQKMDVVHQVYNFSMGFCITCHEEKAKDAQELTMLKDCLTCHY